MPFHVRIVTKSPEVCKSLRVDRWHVRHESTDTLLATHPEVKDERAARARLLRLGLLTSVQLRIQFEPERRLPRQRR
jgi:hypothetical protein